MSDEIENAVKGINSGELKALVRQKAQDGDPDEAVVMAHRIKQNQGITSWGMAFMAIGLVFGLLFFLAWVDGDSVLTDVAASRPVLMLLIVISTIILGGAMLYAAFYKEEVKPEKFQQGREIFLFFSGICATVVGFYFGSGASEQGDVASLSLGTSIEANGTIAVDLAGGKAPYKVSLTSGEGTAQLASTGTSSFALAIQDDVCPAGGTLNVSDAVSEKYPSFQVLLSKDELANAGWKACGPKEAADTTSDETPPQSGG